MLGAPCQALSKYSSHRPAQPMASGLSGQTPDPTVAEPLDEIHPMSSQVPLLLSATFQYEPPVGRKSSGPSSSSPSWYSGLPLHSPDRRSYRPSSQLFVAPAIVKPSAAPGGRLGRGSNWQRSPK